MLVVVCRYASGDTVLEGLESEHERRGKDYEPIRSRCRRGSGGSGNRISGQAYFLALARLDSACVALNGTMIFGPK